MEDKFVWLAVGRLEPAKAYPTLLAPWRDYAAETESCSSAAKVSLQGELAALTEKLGLREKVRFLGLRERRAGHHERR